MVEEVGIGDTKIGVIVVGREVVEGVVEIHLHVLISAGGAANEAMRVGFFIRRRRMARRVKGDMRGVVVEVVEDAGVDKTIVRRVTMAVVAMVVAVADLAGVTELLVNAVDGNLETRKKKITTKNSPNPLNESHPRPRQ